MLEGTQRKLHARTLIYTIHAQIVLSKNIETDWLYVHPAWIFPFFAKSHYAMGRRHLQTTTYTVLLNTKLIHTNIYFQAMILGAFSRFFATEKIIQVYLFDRNEYTHSRNGCLAVFRRLASFSVHHQHLCIRDWFDSHQIFVHIFILTLSRILRAFSLLKITIGKSSVVRSHLSGEIVWKALVKQNYVIRAQ